MRVPILIGLLFLGGPLWAHGGHDDAFKETQPKLGEVRVAPDVQQALGLKIATVGSQRLSNSFEVNGQIQALPNQQAQIKAPIPSRVLRVLVQPGQTVGQGQALAILDSPEIRQLTVEAERGRLQARGQVAQAQARVTLAQRSYEREQRLVQLQISARQELQLAQANLQQAQADLDVARGQLQLSSAQLKTRLAQLGQTQSDGRITITSPLTGVVARQTVSPGEALESGTLLFEVVNLARVWAVAQVYEKDLNRVRSGQAVDVRTESYASQVFRGRISSIDPILNAETRTLAVRAVLENPDGRLKPQMFARLRLVTGQSLLPVTTIPRSAVLDVDGQSIVYVQNGAAFVPTAVQLGQNQGPWVEVKDGLFPGDRVVIERAFQLRAEGLKGESPSEAQPTAAANPLPVGVWLGIAGLAFLAGLVVAGRKHA